MPCWILGVDHLALFCWRVGLVFCPLSFSSQYSFTIKQKKQYGFIQRVPTPEFKGFFPFSSSPSSSICFFNLQMEMVSASRTESGLKSSLLASVKPSNRSRKSLGIVEAHKVLLKGRDGLRAAAGFSKGLNYSLDLVEWAGSESMGAVPVQVLWSSTWSQVWIEEGRRVADAVPRAKFDTHSGGRRPQKVGKQKQLHQREVS